MLRLTIVALLIAACQSGAPSLSPSAPATGSTRTPTPSPTLDADRTPAAGPTPTASPTFEPSPTSGCGLSRVIASRILVACTGPPESEPPRPPLTPRPTRTFESADFLITRVSDDVFLIDPNGMALYTRNNDRPGESSCYERCALRWPPVTLLPGETAAVMPARFGAIGETVRRDGSRQVTFDNKPLYYYSGDTEAITANGMCEKGWGMITPLLVEPLCP